MGGHAAGDVASSIAIGEMVSLDGESPGADDALDLLAQALRTANNQLREATQRQPELQGMGTTVTALLRTGNKIAVADGMGGHAAGDVASSIAIGEMVSLDGESPGADDALDLLAQALRTANNELREATQRQPELQG